MRHDDAVVAKSFSHVGDEQTSREVLFSHPGDPGSVLSGPYVLTKASRILSVTVGWSIAPSTESHLDLYLGGILASTVVLPAGAAQFKMVPALTVGYAPSVLQVAFSVIGTDGSGPTVHVNVV